MNKRTFATMVAFFSMQMAVWAQVTSGYCGDPNVNGGRDVKWELDVSADTTIIISGTGEMANFGRLEDRPWNSFANSVKRVIIDDGVTSVGAGAFAFCEGLICVEGGIDVQVIEEGAFAACFNLIDCRYIIFSAEFIMRRAFAECRSLIGNDESEYNGGSSILYLTAKYVGPDAFAACPKIDEVIMCGNNQEVDEGAFFMCTGLKKLEVGEGVTSIGDKAFAYCENLSKVKCIPTTPPLLGKDVFVGIHPEVEIVLDENVILAYANSDWDKYFDISSLPINSGYCGDPNVNDGKDVKWELSVNGVLTISGNGEMRSYRISEQELLISPWRDDVTSAVIKEGVSNVGVAAFRECKSLKSIELPSSCTIVGDEAFRCCDSLLSISIPEGVTSIGDYAFYLCISLSSISIPEGVTSIGDYAFQVCAALESIVIPEGLTEINKGAFGACFSLKSVTLPKTLTNIESIAFGECFELSTIVIPENVTFIAERAFSNCPMLSDVTCLNSTPPTLAEDSFAGILPTAILRTPKPEAYKASDWALYFPTIVDLDSDVSGINDLNVYGNKSVDIYDLSGHRVSNPIKGCIYIVKGKVTMW